VAHDQVRRGPVYTPGISGSCTFLLALILVLKGYRVRGADAFDMPSNWFSLHPPQGRSSLDALIDRAQGRVERFADRLLDSRRSWRWQHLVYEGSWAVALSVVTCGYLLFGRLFLAKLFFANSRCDGCGTCTEACPVGAIRMLGKANPRPYWSYHCESCMRCAPLCPHKAIEAGQSWGVMLYFLTALWVAYWGISALGQSLPVTAGMQDGWLRYVLGVAYFYPTLFLSYAVFHVANRLKVVNWLFTHTTLTHFWGRYLEPNTRYKHLVPKKTKKPISG